MWASSLACTIARSCSVVVGSQIYSGCERRSHPRPLLRIPLVGTVLLDTCSRLLLATCCRDLEFGRQNSPEYQEEVANPDDDLKYLIESAHEQVVLDLASCWAAMERKRSRYLGRVATETVGYRRIHVSEEMDASRP